MDFAQDPMSPHMANTLLAQVAQEAGHHWYLLCDSAFNNHSVDVIYSNESANCYGREPMLDLAQGGPRLILLHQPGDKLPVAAERLVPWLSHCSGRPMLSVISSPASAEDIAQHWSSLHLVRTGSHERYLLRMADTRTLPLLAHVLKPAQWAAWTQLLARWLYIDRLGDLRELPMPAAGVAPARAPLVLDDDQVDRLALNAESDSMIAYFGESMPEMAPEAEQMRPSRWYQIVDDVLELARQHGVDRTDDKVAMLRVARLTRGASTTDARVLEMLRTKRWQSGAMDGALLATGVLG